MIRESTVVFLASFACRAAFLLIFSEYVIRFTHNGPGSWWRYWRLNSFVMFVNKRSEDIFSWALSVFGLGNKKVSHCIKNRGRVLGLFIIIIIIIIIITITIITII
jgi:hypothetical protein